VHGDIRGTAVSGSSPGSPRALDRGDIATGGGADGEGELVPPPLSLTLPRSHISSPPRPARAFGRGYPCTSQAPPPHPRLRQKIPVHFCRRPHPTRAFAEGYPDTFAGIPHPARAFAEGYPDTFAGIPHPARAFGAPPPPPSGGRGQCVAISGEQPCLGRCLVCNRARFFTGLFPDTGPWGYRHGGWGRRGGGTSSPSPVSNAPEIPHIFSAPPHPCLRQGIPGYLAGLPHPTRAFGAPPPPPSGGRGQCLRYQGNSRIRLFSRISPCTGPWGYRHWGWRLAGRGNSFPLPCLSRSQNSEYLTDPVRVPCRWVPKELAGLPHPARAFSGRRSPCTSQAPPPLPRLRRSSPAPFRGRGQCMAISGEQPYPALLQDLPMCWTVGISPRGVGPTGRGNSFPLPCL